MTLKASTQQVLPRSRVGLSGVGWGGREVAQTMYIHVNKCKNDKMKGEKRKNK
jgi:hypothetical protein